MTTGWRNVTPADAIDYLNDLLRRDREAVTALVGSRVSCNEALSNHETCQVGARDGVYTVGLLGVLNGLFGVDESGWGPITAVVEAEGSRRVIVFEMTKPLQARLEVRR